MDTVVPKLHYYLVDIDGTLTDYVPGALDPSHTLHGNFLFPIIRDMMTERGWKPAEASNAIAKYAQRVVFWDYPDFLAEFNLPVDEGFCRMREWHRKNLIALPTVKLVRELAAEGCSLFIMSNNPYVGCIFKLQAAGLATDDFSSPYFKRIFGTNILRGCKNDPAVWKRAFAQIPVPTAQIGIIGDNPIEDGELPRSLGVGETMIIPQTKIIRGIDTANFQSD